MIVNITYIEIIHLIKGSTPKRRNIKKLINKDYYLCDAKTGKMRWDLKKIMAEFTAVILLYDFYKNYCTYKDWYLND